MELFDTHFHFYAELTPAEFMDRVRETLRTTAPADAPVEKLYLLAMGGDYQESCRARSFAEAVPCACFAAGVHPHQAEDYLRQKTDFAEFARHPRLKAVGELGLDYFYGLSGEQAQKEVFAEFLELALQWSLPAVVHLRDQADSERAYADAEELLTPFVRRGGRFEIHCYAGFAAYLERFLELGAYVGVTGMVTFNKAENIRANLPLIPPERLLLETDSPYLTPVPHRGEENHPGFLPLVAARAAKELGLSVEELAARTTANAKQFFHMEEL